MIDTRLYKASGGPYDGDWRMSVTEQVDGSGEAISLDLPAPAECVAALITCEVVAAAAFGDFPRVQAQRNARDAVIAEAAAQRAEHVAIASRKAAEKAEADAAASRAELNARRGPPSPEEG
jgi:hypothetical protein